MADENKPAFYPRVGRNIAKNFRSAQPPAFIEDPRAMDIPHEYYDIPTKENRELSRRRGERIADLERQKSADTSPLEKLAGGLQAGRFMGSALTQAVNSLPTRLFKGDEAADKFMEERIYKPEQPLAYEYAGDIGNFLEKLETDYKIPPLMPEAVALQYLTGPAKSQAMRMVGKGAEKAGMALERKMEPVVRGALEQGGLPREMALGMGQGTQSNVIKPVGGNWIPNEVENAVKHLKRKTPAGSDVTDILRQMKERYTPEAIAGMQEGSRNNILENIAMLEKDVALNNWVDSNLTNYLKKQLGTEKDPVRMLADQGITHYATQGAMRNALDTSYDQFAQNRKLRKIMGMPEEPMAKEPMGRIWEEGIDNLLDQGNMVTAKQLKGGNLWRDNPWLQNLPPNTTLYRLDKPSVEDMNLQHIMDVLREDLVSGRIKPEDVKNISMDRAVRRAHEYNLEMAEKLKDAKAKKLEQMTVYKDYPDQGYKWVQLEKPGDFAAESDAMGHSVRGYEPYKGHPDWTEGSGDRGSPSYGLGGWEAIKRGDAKIYSLIDKKGEPHATVEVGSDYDSPAWYQKNKKLFESDTRIPSKNGQWDNVKLLHRWYNDNAQSASDYVHGISKYLDEAGIPYVPAERTAPKIHQIKGKSNAAPNENYLPYVQDFVKSGNWADVGDLKNTGLHKLGSEYLTAQEAESKYKPMVADALNYLETHPSLERHRAARQARNDFKGDTTSPEYRDLERKAGENIAKDVPYTYAELKALLSSPEDWTDHGETIYTPLSTALGQIEKAKKSLGPLPPTEGMKRGGKVSISNNPDAMMLEVNNAHMAGGGLAKLLRAAPKSAEEIKAIAERMAPQLLGEFVRGDKGTQSVAGKTQKQFAKEKEMKHDIRPTGAERPVPKPVNIEELKDQVIVGIPGDPTISGQTLHSLNDIPLESPSPQHGGPLYGLGHEGDAFWASGLGAANRVQNLAREASQQYDAPVLGKYIMMGPESINYAQHFADANLSAINPDRMTKGQIESFNNLIREGYPYKKKGESFQRVFPAFPGIENPAEAYLHFSIDPELRKHFNALMQMPTITEKHGLPSGIDVRHAITEPDLRDLETGVTGKAIGRLRPDVVELGLSSHPTYSHDIPGEFLGSSAYPIPYELSFPDTIKAIRENPKQAPHEFGSLKMVGPRQIIDQQLIDEIKQYEEQIKRLTGKKKGGAVKKAAGGAITGDDLIIEERPL